LEIISKLNLININLSYCNIQDDMLKCFSNLVNLKKIKLSCCENVTDCGIFYLGKNVYLKKINLSFCKKITDQGLCYFSALRNLMNLNISNCKKVTEMEIDYFKDFSNIDLFITINRATIKSNIKKIYSEIGNLKNKENLYNESIYYYSKSLDINLKDEDAKKG